MPRPAALQAIAGTPYRIGNHDRDEPVMVPRLWRVGSTPVGLQLQKSPRATYHGETARWTGTVN